VLPPFSFNPATECGWSVNRTERHTTPVGLSIGLPTDFYAFILICHTIQITRLVLGSVPAIHAHRTLTKFLRGGGGPDHRYLLAALWIRLWTAGLRNQLDDSVEAPGPRRLPRSRWPPKFMDDQRPRSFDHPRCAGRIYCTRKVRAFEITLI